MAGVVASPAGAVAAMVVGSLGTACSDVVVDSIVVERSRGQPQAHPDPVSWLKRLLVYCSASYVC